MYAKKNKKTPQLVSVDDQHQACQRSLITVIIITTKKYKLCVTIKWEKLRNYKPFFNMKLSNISGYNYDLIENSK